MIRRIALALGLMLCAAAPAVAANCSSYPYTLTNGSTADANQVMSNFNSILSCGNNNLAHNGANSDITSLSGLTTAITIGQGGTGQTTASSALTALGALDQPMARIYASDTGSANAYAVAPSPAFTSYAAGMNVYMKVAHTNTGASTVNVNSLGTKNIFKQGTSGPTALTASPSAELEANMVVDLVYDGTEFQIVGPITANLATPISVANGGTGASTLTSHGVVVGQGTSAVHITSAGGANQVLAGNASADPTFQNSNSLTGTITVGTTNTLNPYAISTEQSQAHGLGAYPDFIVSYVQCLTAEGGFSVGDRVYADGSGLGHFAANNGFIVSADTTNTYITTSSGGNLQIFNKSTGAFFTITAANWEIVVIPYNIN
jgi:hypothetical protein